MTAISISGEIKDAIGREDSYRTPFGTKDTDYAVGNSDCNAVFIGQTRNSAGNNDI